MRDILLDVPGRRIYNYIMLEIKGRKFEGALEELISGDDVFKKLLEEVYDIPEDDEERDMRIAKVLC